MDVVLFHSACGLRPAVHAAADRLRATGHQMRVPDPYGDQTVETAEEGRWTEGRREAPERTRAAPRSPRPSLTA